MDTCNQARKIHGKKWKRKVLFNALNAYGFLPSNYNIRIGKFPRKFSAILNIFLAVKHEASRAAERGRDGPDMPMAQNLCDLLNGNLCNSICGKEIIPHFIGLEQFVKEMNKRS